jgi:hypothetical protein
MAVVSFNSRTDHDEARQRQDLVADLHDRLKGVGDLKAFPTDFKYALEHKVWESERELAGGSVLKPTTLHNFIHSEYPEGLGVDYAMIERLIGDRQDVLALWTEVTKRKPGRPEKAESENVYNVHDKDRPSGNTAEAGLRKLQKSASEGNEDAERELSLVKAGEKKVHTACVDAGLRKSTRIDADVKARCHKAIAEWIVSHGGHDDLSPVVSDLFACGAKGIAIEVKNLIGESIMDRRYS